MCWHHHTVWEYQEEICTDCGLVLQADPYHIVPGDPAEEDPAEDPADEDLEAREWDYPD